MRPLLLISQIQRSGGTLLSRLFDGHPQCAAYPHELKIGSPQKWDWPELALEQPVAAWLDALNVSALAKMAARGYVKPGSNPFALRDVHPFSFSTDEFAARFSDILACRPPHVQRDVLDAYFESFFASWTDRKATGEERWVVAFTPRVNMTPASVDRFWRDYPDGRMISLVREPAAWFASAVRHDPKRFGDLQRSLHDWGQSASAALDLAQHRGGQVQALLFEDLVSETRATMDGVARFARIAWDDALLQPTYGGRPVRPNSSFAIAEAGVHRAPLTRAAGLAPDVRAEIEATCGARYRECVAWCQSARTASST